MVPERSQARANPARGIALIATAVIVGIFLLRNGKFDGGEAVADAVAGGTQTTVTPPADGSAGTTAPDATEPTRPFAEITVRVGNSTEVSGAAKRLSDLIAEAGYQVVEPTDSPPGSDPNTTIVLYAAGFDREAATLAGQVGAAPESIAPFTEPPQLDPGGAQLIVLLGNDRAT